MMQGLGLNCTLRCLSFKGAAIGDELFEELARGLVRNTSLQVRGRARAAGRSRDGDALPAALARTTNNR